MDSIAYPLVRHEPPNTCGRDFIVGDLHGCVDALRYLLREIKFIPAQDRLFSVGDLIDRSNHSEEALTLLERPWFYAVRGNHEEVLCEVAAGRMQRDWWYSIGGEWAAALTQEQLSDYANHLRQLPLIRVVGYGARRFNILHAEFFGCDADLDRGIFTDRAKQQLLWGRELVSGKVNPAQQPGLSPTYCGHTPVSEMVQIGAQIFIDTGACVSSGKLTITEALTTRSWSISSAQALANGAANIALP